MSHKLKERAAIALRLSAAPGITIRLLDAGLREIARSNGTLETRQPEGLYLIEWSWGGEQSQQMILLDHSGDPRVIKFDPSSGDVPAPLSAAAEAHGKLVDAVVGRLRPPESSQESSIVLIIAGEADTMPGAEQLELSLLNPREVAVEPKTTAQLQLALGAGGIASCYQVRPGRYHIAFRSVTGERLAQSVPALGGRQTLVFLTAHHANLLVADGERLATDENVGIEPARTVVVTVRGDEDAYRVRERVRLAGALLHDLANRGNPFSSDVVRVLDDAATDPLLRLYGAVLALGCLERNISPSPAEIWRDDPGAIAAQRRIWARRIRNWAGDPGRVGLPPDALALCWGMQRLSRSLVDLRTRARMPSRIEVPPMLDFAWRWAIEESVERPEAVKSTAIVTAAARSAVGAGPWLCWKVTSSKAQSAQLSRRADSLPILIQEVASKAGQVVGLDVSSESNRSTRNVADSLDMLSPEVLTAAIRTLQVATASSASIGSPMVAQLALSLGLPLRQLQKRLIRVREEIDAVIQASGATPETEVASPAGPLAEAPGLSRRITNPDDLQSGRFGGESKRGAFRLSAEFSDTKWKNWVKVTLFVTGPALDGEEVQFHLHDSFHPPFKERRFRNGRARLSEVVWGGFTVGVWIPAHGIELELNLTRLRNAPKVIKLR